MYLHITSSNVLACLLVQRVRLKIFTRSLHNMKLQYGDNQSDEEKVRIFYQPIEKQKVATDFKQDLMMCYRLHQLESL